MESEKLNHMRDIALKHKRLTKIVKEKQADAVSLSSPRFDGIPSQHNCDRVPPVQKHIEQIDKLNKEIYLIEEELTMCGMEMSKEVKLKGIPTETHAMARLYYLGGRTLQDIANIKGIKKDSVWAKIRTFNKKIVDKPQEM